MTKAKDILSILEGEWKDGTRPADLYDDHVAARPAAYAETIVAGLASKHKRIHNGCAELASRLSADHPELLYPHVQLFVRNLAAPSPVLRWEAVCTVGNLASVDVNRVIPKHLDELLGFLSDDSIVLQGHAVRALAKIATSRRELGPKILEALLASERHFPGTRVGYLVEATEAFAGEPRLIPTLRRFLASHAGSDLAPVARKANRALKRIGR